MHKYERIVERLIRYHRVVWLAGMAALGWACTTLLLSALEWVVTP